MFLRIIFPLFQPCLKFLNIFFVLFVFPFLQAGPLDNWASFLAWAIFIIIPLIVTVLLSITTAHEDDNDSKKN